MRSILSGLVVLHALPEPVQTLKMILEDDVVNAEMDVFYIWFWTLASRQVYNKN